MKTRAIKKVQVALDKMLDLNLMLHQTERVDRLIDQLRELENLVQGGKSVNGKIKFK
jgi:hypothetical protein